jgi:hypothetical protein
LTPAGQEPASPGCRQVAVTPLYGAELNGIRGGTNDNSFPNTISAPPFELLEEDDLPLQLGRRVRGGCQSPSLRAFFIFLPLRRVRAAGANDPDALAAFCEDCKQHTRDLRHANDYKPVRLEDVRGVDRARIGEHRHGSRNLTPCLRSFCEALVASHSARHTRPSPWSPPDYHPWDVQPSFPDRRRQGRPLPSGCRNSDP